jgi:pimeloyl-ACP methyl ester carboxylesterase
MTTVRERHVRAGGVGLHLREAGEGDPLLLLHGWPQHGGMWDPLLGELSERHRVLVPDLRGFGRSEAPPGDYGKHALAADVLALMDAEGIERAAVVGHDWGGWIAWLLALEHPQRVERFAALDVPPPRREGTASLRRLPLQLLFGSYQYVISTPMIGERFVRSPDNIRRFIKGASTRAVAPELVDDYARATSKPGSVEASVALYRTFLVREVPRILTGSYTERKVTVPGLVVMGEESGIVKAFGMPAPEPGVDVRALPGAGHFIVDEAPEEVLALLRPFLVS